LVPHWELGRFCYKCGQPYPWTAAALAAARELVSLAGGLGDGERVMLSSTFDDLVRDTLWTPVAAARAKFLIAKAGRDTASALRDILVGLMTEAAKRQVGM
jgi:hypothetical protein